MQTYRNIGDIPYDNHSVVTVGTFDGVHLGHRRILERMRAFTTDHGGRTVLITFEPHPRLVLSRSIQPTIGLLTTLAEKHAILQRLGIDVLVILPFTFEFAQTHRRTLSTIY